jgi:UDP-N-acetyl-D-glucosamine dehydrogenase
VGDALNDRAQAVKGSRALVVGVAYKPGIDDLRESPALDILELLAERGADVHWYDPHVPELPTGIRGERHDEWTREAIDGYDAVIVVTPHADVDHSLLAGARPVVIDTRNALKGHGGGNVVKL